MSERRNLAMRLMGPMFLGLVGAALWFSWSSQQKANAALRRLKTAERDWQVMSLAEPVPTAAVAQAWAERRGSLERELHRVRRELGENVNRDPAPTQRAEAFFAIAQFVEAQREMARAAGVTLPEGYALGFSTYANSGPPDAELAIVHRQLRVAEALLSVLWRSGAKELTRVQREVPASKLHAAHATSRAGRPEDFLQQAAGRSLARAGIVDTLALRIGFIGRTSTLRRYLNDLGQLPLPFIVRAVEVEPLGADGAARGGVRTLADLFGEEVAARPAEGTEATAVPVISANESEFLVTVEVLDFSPMDQAPHDQVAEGSP